MNASTARILVIDDDAVFADVLARSLQRRGPIALAANSLAGALASGADSGRRTSCSTLKLGADDGLLALPELLARWPQARVLLLTGYASIATAVAAIKRGAHDYLAKPADAAQVLRALGLVDADASAEAASPERPLAWNRVAWEHIQRVLQEQGGNVAATARALGMHRRTLQRILRKHAPTA
ncbi:MAG: response regulator [Xanthomonadales bacterium]|nr:response regulator [Xanthomonadales bacterium]